MPNRHVICSVVSITMFLAVLPGCDSADSATAETTEAEQATADVQQTLDVQTSPPAACTVTDALVDCQPNITRVRFSLLSSRDVYWQKPVAAPPPNGYPVVVIYQGSNSGPDTTWGPVAAGSQAGIYYQAKLQATLLERGFIVVAPEHGGFIGWQTNWGIPYELTPDYAFIKTLLTKIGAGTFGPADTIRLYAAGFSSGGYMTSRMAISHQGVFRALAIQSASYATCLGPICAVPPASGLPDNHPPTLFLHGAEDGTVPLWTAAKYHESLVANGTETQLVVDPTGGHEWHPESPERVTDWFLSH